jgi:hypothetical protein
MAAEGMTNREIAQALFVTLRTVEMHLSTAFRKLDISSRTQLPAALTSSALPLVAMFLGMAVFRLPADAALVALGTSSGDVYEDAPTLMLIAMTVAMTVPMVAWMRYRGHRRQPSMEMAASMVIPTLGLLALLWTGS